MCINMQRHIKLVTSSARVWFVNKFKLEFGFEFLLKQRAKIKLITDRAQAVRELFVHLTTLFPKWNNVSAWMGSHNMWVIVTCINVTVNSNDDACYNWLIIVALFSCSRSNIFFVQIGVKWVWNILTRCSLSLTFPLRFLSTFVNFK